MNAYLNTITTNDISTLKDTSSQETTLTLEQGRIVYLPNYSFKLQADEQVLLSESILKPKHKNISYNYQRKHLAGLNTTDLSELTQAFMERFALYSKELIDTLLPQYQQSVRWGRTSYRPAEIKGRATSKRKDDTRVHVDSFAATPVHGLRILRVFCNINPHFEPRVWHVGEAFTHVMKRFSPQIPTYNPIQAKLLQWIKATKTLRSPYDHYMLKLHDTMKLDDHYQATVTKQRIEFPANSTWVVFTDHVSHAALSGQFLLEQTFYLPVEAMVDPKSSPLKQWETELNSAMI